MRNPWLDIPLAEYEGHMEHVGQARMLDRVFGQALQSIRPQSVAVLGASGGNGFGHLIATKVMRTVALDLNRTYLQQLERRFRDRVQGLEILCGDLANPAIGFAPVDLVYSALIFEYVDIDLTLTRIRNWLRPDGALWVVLQMQDEAIAKITSSPFDSVARLRGSMTLRDTDNFREAAATAGLTEYQSETLTLPGGKRFFSACYRPVAFGRAGQKV